MDGFEIVGAIRDIETIAIGRGVRVRRHLNRVHGKGRWRKMKVLAMCALRMGKSVKQKSIGSKRTESDGKTLRSKGSFDMSEFVICINNKCNPASLIIGKVYRKLHDEKAELQSMIRVIDEDTEELDGYLYPATMFSPVDLPEQARRALILSYVKP